ncbi:MAG: glycosyltransferase family 4 protein [Candidatus Omnitrophica bacterium]|nr:glycosyltransferase family 4 protein [Candidatus Omnitrophota bacterium]
MKVSLYYPWVYLKGGAERLISELITRSRHDWTIFTNHFDRENTFKEFSKVPVVELKRVSVKREISEVLKATLLIAGQKIPAKDFDARCVVIDSIGSFINVKNKDLPVFSICLTPLRLVYDPHYSKHYHARKKGKEHPVLTGGKSVFRFFDRMCWQHYGKVFCISGEVKNRVSSAGIIDHQKLQVVYPGVNLDFYKPGEGASEQYFLLPGRIMWTKNIELGIDAFRLFCEKNKGFELRIAGIVDAKSQEYYDMLQKKAEGLPVKFLTKVSDHEMLKLYQNSFAVLFTPFNEDWGFIPLEAMACGKPCVAVNRGGPRESVQNGETGLLVDPDPAAFSGAMDKLANDPALVARIKTAGLEHVKKFTWAKFVETIDCYIDNIEKKNQQYQKD